MNQTTATRIGRHYEPDRISEGALRSRSVADFCVFITLSLIPIAWLALIAGHTAAYISPVVVVVALAEYGIYKSIRPNSFEQKERRLLYALAALLSIGVALANHAQMSMARGALDVLLGFPVFYAALAALWRLADKHTICEGAKSREQREVFIFLRYFALLLIACLAYLLFCNYPGALSPDSLSQVSQILGFQYSNHHPFWHTMLISMVFRPTYSITGSLTAAVVSYSVFQSLMQAAVMSLGLSTLERMGQTRGRVWTIALAYACLPQFLTYSSTMWKDIPFALACLLLVVGCAREQRRVGGDRSNIFFIALGLLGTCAMRNNGIYVAIVFVPFACAFLAKGDRRVPVAGALVATLALGIFMRYPAITFLGVTSQDASRESLSIPIQQISRVCAGGGLSEGQVEQLSHFLSVEEIPEYYKPYISDPIKAMMNDGYLNGHLGEFLTLWLWIGAEHPAEYVAAWSDQTAGYWYGGYQYWIWQRRIAENDFGLVWAGGPMAALFDGYASLFSEDGIPSLIVSVGMMDILTLLIFAYGALRGRRDVMLAALPSLLVVLTLLVATPVFCEYRYAYTVSITLPFLISLLLCRPCDAADSCEGLHS